MSAETAVTLYVDASNGVKYAYRRIGANASIPLVMHIHYRANMDLWDPLFINTLAQTREVIIFDNAGVGRSTGEVAETFQGWADQAIAFMEALGLNKVDFLGFSMGGMAAQLVALTVPHLVRKLILAGTTASTPSAEHVDGVVWPREQAPSDVLMALRDASTPEEGAKSLEFSFFYHDSHGRSKFEEYWRRLQERTAEPLHLELLDRDGGAKKQMLAAVHASTPGPSGSFDRLAELKMPVLVANGDKDLLIPSSRSWELVTQILNAQLVIYPKAGHGFIWQYAELFATHINRFLDGSEFDDNLSAKL
ncbi:hypothetical protein PV10_08500 [Exophiala mesophila]|uniref:AB hydrolase-1 domain-containing protein n=1 Tax=Exophiala mesophila TaxID=212818 RepID=A0A0D1Z256_EXOME|nr:uncharacterized protein PV10_08500 [Exophiala mesophila]KIV88867.1 hypothetical protein PV10_08500 [Exophiala mesophila]